MTEDEFGADDYGPADDPAANDEQYGGAEADAEDLWGEDLSNVGQPSGDAVDRLEDLQDDFDELAERYAEKTQESQELMSVLNSLESGDYEAASDGAKGTARKYASKLPVVGDRLAKAGAKKSVTRQLKIRYETIQQQHEQMGEFTNELGDYLDEQEQLRDEAWEEYKDAMEERQAVEEELEEAMNEYKEVLGELVAAGIMQPAEAIQKALDEDEAAEYAEQDVDLDPNEQMELQDQRMNLEDDRIRPLRDELGELSERELRAKSKWETADMYMSKGHQMHEAANKLYQRMQDYEHELEQAIENEAKTGKVMEQAQDIAETTEDTKELLRETARLRADQVVELERVSNEVWGENPIDEETANYVSEKLQEAEEVRAENEKEAHRRVRNEEK